MNTGPQNHHESILNQALHNPTIQTTSGAGMIGVASLESLPWWQPYWDPIWQILPWSQLLTVLGVIFSAIGIYNLVLTKIKKIREARLQKLKTE